MLESCVVHLDQCVWYGRCRLIRLSGMEDSSWSVCLVWKIYLIKYGPALFCVGSSNSKGDVMATTLQIKVSSLSNSNWPQCHPSTFIGKHFILCLGDCNLAEFFCRKQKGVENLGFTKILTMAVMCFIILYFWTYKEQSVLCVWDWLRTYKFLYNPNNFTHKWRAKPSSLIKIRWSGCTKQHCSVFIIYYSNWSQY